MNDDLRITPSHAATRTEKASAEAELGPLAPLAAEQRLASFYAGCPVALFTTTPEGRFIDANRAFALLLGYADPTHFLDLPVPTFYSDPRKRQEIMGILDREGAVHGHEIEFVRLDGTRVWVSITARAIRDTTGRVVRYEGALEDVTPRRRAQDLLSLSDQRFHLLARATNDTLWDWDFAAETVWWSENFERTFGYRLDELEPGPESWMGRIHPDDLDRVYRSIHDAIEGTATTWSEEYRFRRADGEHAIIYDRGLVLRDGAGKAIRMIGSMMDATLQRRQQILLAWQRKVLEMIALHHGLEETLEALCRDAEELAAGRRFTVLLASDDGLRLLHGAAPSLPASYNTAVHGLLIGPRAGSCGTAAHRRAPVVVEDIATDPLWADFRHLALPLGLCACWSTPILSSKGEVLGTWAVYRPSPGAPTAADEEVVRVATRLAAIAIERARADLALRQRAEELARLTEALQRSNRELDQFAYVTSHDLKAPLRGIANLSQWIEDDEHEHLSEVSKRNLELLRNRVQRMDALIDAILEYSRVGRIRVPTEVVAVGPLIEEVVDLLSPPGGFRVEVAGLLPSVVAERTLLQQVFMNLIGNAIKHHRDRASGRAVVSCADAGSHWRFTVADNGPGISPRFHDKVFVIFQTLEARDTSEGTGVGLALVKKIVEGSGGAVVLDSDVGRGAAFSFTWPKGLG
ncbi:PAS domain-containing sensor histidine kinase [Sorangium sp. So ce887]|uniref:PAS domain-containing sensor histidine kinase n=1 Tax=Sorangium sp. So ce887 TaxID=3133324 RepID=UPI003F6330F2